MPPLSANLIDRYRQILLDSDICASAETLRSVFVGELAAYKYYLPGGINALDRASKLIAYLEPRKLRGRPVLLMLLERLPPHMPDDDTRSELEQLYYGYFVIMPVST